MQNQLNYLRALITTRFGNDDERGASAVEYGLLIGFIAVAIIGILVALGPHIAGLFNDVEQETPQPQNPVGGGA